MEVGISHNPLVRIVRAFERIWARLFGFDIFISYAREDGRVVADRLHEELTKSYIVFVDDRTIEHGERFGRRIERELRRTRLLVVVLSEKALESRWVEREVEIFFSRKGNPRAVPIFVPPITPEHLDDHPEPLSKLADFHGLILASLLPSAQNSDGVALKEFESLFKGTRQRVKARRALAASILAFLVVIGLGIEGTRRAQRDNEITKWIADAQRAEDAGRFDQAEWAYANAWWLSKGSRQDVMDQYLDARGRRYFERLDFSIDPNEVALAVSEHADGFFLVSGIPESSTLHLRSLHDSSTIELRDPEALLEVSVMEGWLLVETIDRLWVQPAELDSEGRWLDGMEELVDVLVHESILHLLFRHEMTLVARSYQLPDTSEESMSSYPLPPDSVITTCRVLGDGSLFVAGDQSEPDGGWVPTAWLRAPMDEEWTAHSAPRELSLAPQCFHAYVSPRAKIASLSLSPVDFSNNTATKPARNLYMRLDDDFMLSWLAHSGFWTPALLEPGIVDLVFKTESGDLKWLEQPSVVLTQVEPITLASNVSSFLSWFQEDDVLPTLAVAREDGRLDLLVEGDLWSRYPLPQGPAHLIETENHSLIAVNTLDGVLLLRRARPFEPSVPRLDTLRSELLLLPDEE